MYFFKETLSRPTPQTPNQLFFIWCLWSRLIWVSLKTLTFTFRFVKMKCQILFQGISDTIKIVIYYIVTIGSSEKKVPWSGFIFHFIMKMVKRNISFYERKKKLLQKHEFCTKGKLHIMGKFLSWIFQRSEIQCSFDSKVDVRLYFL